MHVFKTFHLFVQTGQHDTIYHFLSYSPLVQVNKLATIFLGLKPFMFVIYFKFQANSFNTYVLYLLKRPQVMIRTITKRNDNNEDKWQCILPRKCDCIGIRT